MALLVAERPNWDPLRLGRGRHGSYGLPKALTVVGVLISLVEIQMIPNYAVLRL
jgi:hypothetical protein